MKKLYMAIAALASMISAKPCDASTFDIPQVSGESAPSGSAISERELLIQSSGNGAGSGDYQQNILSDSVLNDRARVQSMTSGGGGNTAIIVQKGTANKSKVVQSGDNNYAKHTQDGDDNDIVVEQSGENNVSEEEQKGSKNKKKIIQNGQVR
jgi:hypothetical protein